MTEDRRVLAGRYQLGELIARGGMSEVHKGLDSRLGRTVAIKLLKPSLALDPTFRMRFRQEAQAAARMAHPTIVRVFDAGEETVRDASGHEIQAPFIIMEYVDGTPLNELIARGPLPMAQAMSIAAGILTALEYSHRAGVVHRDIKPGNVLITRTGQVKVTDFGIARAVSETSPSLAKTTSVIGTAAYFSPEQARSEQVDARTDLYSTGVVLFEMLTGQPPFSGETPVAVAYKHISEIPPKASAVNPRVSPAADLVVARALQKDRNERYQTAVEFRDELELAASGKLPIAKRADPGESLFVAPAPPSRTEATLRQLAEDSQMVRTQSRPPAIWIWTGVVAVIAVIGALVIWVLTQNPSNPLAGLSRTVPTVIGEPSAAAQKAIGEADLKVSLTQQASSTVPAGHVISTDPAGGQVAAKNTVVTVIVSSGRQLALVPDVTNQTASQAQQALVAAGFKAGSVTKQDSPTTPDGLVMATKPAASAEAAGGSTIDIVVSTGMVALPNLVGEPIAQATQQLQSPSLQLLANPIADPTCPTQANTPVSAQSIAPGEVAQGTAVTLKFCTG